MTVRSRNPTTGLPRRTSDTEPLRILHVYPNPSRIGGIERSLSMAVSALNELGHQSYLLCETTDGAELPDFVEVLERPDLLVHEPLPPWQAARLRRDVLELVERIAPDLIHVRGGLRPPVLEAVAAARPTVVNVHVPLCPNGARYRYKDEAACERAIGIGCVTSGFVSHGCGRIATGEPVSVLAFARSLRTTRQMLRTLGRCHSVIASSKWQAARLVEDGVPVDRVVVIRPPIFSASPAERYNPPVVAAAGRLVTFKGLHHLLRASTAIGTPHQIWIIGDGPERDRLERLARELGIRDRVTFHGAVGPERADDLLSHTTVVAAPSLLPETFHQVGAQAASSGIAVVGYDVGAMREWADKYPHAKLVPAGDWRALAEQIEGSLAVTPARNGACSTAFSQGSHAKHLLAAYEKALRNAAGG